MARVLTPRLARILDLQTVAAGALPAGVLHVLKDFKGFDQVQPKWCWAAVVATVYRHYSGESIEPCEWAAIRLGGPRCGCCHKPGGCDSDYDIEAALGSMAGGVDGPVRAERIAAEIDAKPHGRPIVCVQFTEAHVVVIYGIEERGGQHFVYWFDPDGDFYHLGDTEIQAFTQGSPGWSVTIFTQPVFTKPGGPRCP
ncbi:MAG TPA: papain-like cysteine protease family protein [Thermoanaerobaculia bacterium]|nr:papain-like cysteine protease family protein [Thermoanaerobaculia bacterium]